MPPALAFAALPPSISRYACASAASYSPWNLDARCAFTSSCCTLTCESDEMIRRVVMADQCCTSGAATGEDGRVGRDSTGGKRMDVAALLAGAQEQAGSDDYGPDADAMHEALEVLVRSANDEASLSEQGEMVFAGMIGSLLTRRLQIEQCYAAHPEIADQ